MPKLKRKKKPELDIKKLADSINQISADAEGISLKEYYKKQAIRKKASSIYAKTHWVQPLTDAQKFFIATTTDKPHHYMDLPLSKGNETAIEVFKKTSKNYKDWVIKNNKYMNKLDLTNMNDTRHNLKRAMDNINKSTEPLRQLKQKFDEATEPLRKMQKDYQDIGRKLRFKSDRQNLGIMSLVKANKITGGLEIWGQSENFTPPYESMPPQVHVGYLLNKANKEKKLAVSNGLNSYMDRHKMKKPMEIAKHYLSTHKDPKKADYIVDSFDNSVALAEGTGVSPKRVFELICNELVKSEKLYKRLDFERDAHKVEELLNLFDSKVLEKKSVKYTQQQFFASKERKAWTAKYGYDWKDYKRFNEDFNQWNKVFKAQAKLREESDADMFAQFLGEQARGK